MIRGSIMPHRILFIEDMSPSVRDECGTTLDIVSEFVRWDSPLPERLCRRRLDLVVAVAVPGRRAAHSFFQWLAKTPIGAPTLAVLSGDEDLMRAAMKAVDDFVVVPFSRMEFHHRIARLLGGEIDERTKAAAHENLTQELGLTGLVGNHAAFLHSLKQIPAVARSHSPVLITGETGTGKELCARAIHYLSSRRHLPFIAVDCAALPEHLFESEMFGHARGAFTDAYRDQEGLVALAGDGTLFLDEVDSLPITAQSKLLRLLQEHSYRPVGSTRFTSTRARIVATCNQDLERLVQEKKFRSDLFFRLNVLRLQLMPLRQRRSDVALLSRHFLETLAVEHGTARKTLAPALIQMLMDYDWPGNVRELYNVLQRAVLLCPSTNITLEHITHVPIGKMAASVQLPQSESTNFREARARAVMAFERSYIEETLRCSGGNVTRAACLAGKDRRVFSRLMKRHHITRDLG